MNGHTPGPWRKSERHECFGCVWTVGEKSFVVADAATNPLPCDEQRANARLMAAAPELLAACKQFEAMIPLLRMLTVGQVLAAGDAAIDAAGLNPYCINEGLAEGHEQAISDWKLEGIRAAIAKATGASA